MNRERPDRPLALPSDPSLAAIVFGQATQRAASAGGRPISDGMLRLERSGYGSAPRAVLSAEDTYRATGFDPAWGTPPSRPGLRWNEHRLLCEPAWATSGSSDASLRTEHARFVRLSRAGIFRQWHQSAEDGRASWRLRWIRAFTDVPDPATPYEVLPDNDPSLE
jgi:hypothetical protein